MVSVHAESRSQDALPVCLGKENPYRLVSLYEMLRAHAEKFVRAAHYLSTIEWSALAITTGDSGVKGASQLQRETETGRLKSEMVSLKEQCDLMGLTSTSRHIDRFLPSPILDPAILVNFMQDITLRFQEDLEKQMFLQLNLDSAKFYAEPIGGWRRIADRFKCEVDIEESRKCFALERFTASVFHSMKIVESGVLELQMFLKQPDVKAHFGSVLSKLETMTQKQEFQHLPPHLQPYKQFMTDVLAQLHAVKDSWRNKVSHVGAHIVPEGIFTEEMARGIHDATLLLMGKLADGLPA